MKSSLRRQTVSAEEIADIARRNLRDDVQNKLNQVAVVH